MNVAFLDVDGVLNCMSTTARVGKYKGIDPAKVKLLKEIVDLMDAKIVLTSTWKEWWAKDPKKRNQFGNHLVSRLAGQGLSIYDKTTDDGWHRGAGIMAWLDRHPVKSFVILDDEPFDYKQLGLDSHWLQTAYYDNEGGLTEERVQTFKEHLSEYRNTL